MNTTDERNRGGRGETTIREHRESDIAFIVDSWLKSYRGSTFARYVRGDEYYTGHRHAIERAMRRAATTILVAHAPDDTETILGWICYEHPGVLHYLFVRPLVRKLGVSRQLIEALPEEPVFYSHFTLALNGILRRMPRAVYSPYLFLR